jgi:uncharacterized repeat protein (TIGR03803 family)
VLISETANREGIMLTFELTCHARCWRRACTVFLLCAATAIASAQTFKTLVNLDATTGANPARDALLIQGPDGNFYGTTTAFGVGSGTVFKVSTSGTLTTLYSFCARPKCADGFEPSGLVLGADGNFYGVTAWGGNDVCEPLYGCGTVFKITPGGTLTTLHAFEHTDGEVPLGPLVQGSDGNLYGVTGYGGINCACGTAFRITTAGVFTELHTFTGPEGAFPSAALIQGPDSRFYGVTLSGGSSETSCASDSCGTVFVMSSAGSVTTLHTFDYTDGAYPDAALLLGRNGNFYGTTYGGGSNTCLSGCGTLFRITRTGTLTTLHRFDLTDGNDPTTVIQGSDGNFYGATFAGGSSGLCPDSEGNGGCGTLFAMTPAGALTTLYDFGVTYGLGPGELFQSTNGTFYGMTWGGGTFNFGTIYSLALGLGPFVQTLPTAGNIGQRVLVLGNNLAGTTSVTFNGVPATFSVVSPTFIKAAVPADATTGPVQVITPNGKLTSNVSFRVR